MNVFSHRIIRKEIISSSYLGKERPVRVFLPPGYNELVTYRVVYCQDGEECFNFGRIVTHASRLILEEIFEPFIIVGADVDMPNRTREYSPDGDRFQAYCRFFLDELIPHIEGRYPIRSGDGDRILVGDSLGATVSLQLSLQAPDLFQKVISLSGAFLRTSVELAECEKDLSWLKLYQLIGTDETQVETSRGVFDFWAWNLKMREVLQRKGAVLNYVEKPGKHLWGFWQKELPDALRWALAD